MSSQRKVSSVGVRTNRNISLLPAILLRVLSNNFYLIVAMAVVNVVRKISKFFNYPGRSGKCNDILNCNRDSEPDENLYRDRVRNRSTVNGNFIKRIKREKFVKNSNNNSNNSNNACRDNCRNSRCVNSRSIVHHCGKNINDKTMKNFNDRCFMVEYKSFKPSNDKNDSCRVKNFSTLVASSERVDDDAKSITEDECGVVAENRRKIDRKVTNVTTNVSTVYRDDESVEDKRNRIINYIRQRKLLFARNEDYFRLLSSLEQCCFDFNEQAFIDAVRLYVLLAQRVVRCPKSLNSKYECDLAYRTIYLVIERR